jgi:hypothetical protein
MKELSRVELRISADLKKLLVREAECNNMSLNEYIKRCLWKRHAGRPQDRWMQEWTEANLIY